MKKKPCEFCEADNIDAVNEQFGGYSLNVEIYPDNNFIGVSVSGCDEGEHEVDLEFAIPMRYCPNCGRKLC